MSDKQSQFASQFSEFARRLAAAGDNSPLPLAAHQLCGRETAECSPFINPVDYTCHCGRTRNESSPFFFPPSSSSQATDLPPPAATVFIFPPPVTTSSDRDVTQALLSGRKVRVALIVVIGVTDSCGRLSSGLSPS